MPKELKHDPLRAVWRSYCGQVTVEGLLLVFGGIALLASTDQFLKMLGKGGLGWIMMVIGLGIAYLFVIGVAKPYGHWKRAKRFPKTKDLPGTLRIIIPELAKEERTLKELRAHLGQKKPYRWFGKKRLIINTIVFILGLSSLLLLFNL